MIALVNKLAAQIRKANETETRSTSMQKAWATIKAAGNAAVLTFKKIAGDICTRIVCADWSKFYTVKGGGKQTAPGQILFADLVKVAMGINPIISTYESRVISIN